MTQDKTPRWQWLSLVLLLTLGLLVRLTDLTDLPLDFHPTRQLFSALKARGMYYAWSPPAGVPEAQREFAIRQWQALATIEPPLLEVLTAFTYRFTGEHLWVPRLYSLLFWTLGALAVYALGRRLASSAGGLLAAGVYLFLPYGVIASRSFQPDPLMVTLIVSTVTALSRWGESRRLRWVVLAGLLGGLAVLVKSVAIFFVGGAFGALALGTFGLRRTIRDWQAWLIAVLMIAPAAVYTLYGVFVAGTLGSQFGGRFIPSLLIDPLFYLRWEGNIQQTVTVALFALAIPGALLVRERGLRWMLLGWWAGYLLYSLVFNYHASTHDYYQLPLIPLVAASLAPYVPLLNGALEEVEQPRRRLIRLLLIAALLLTLAAAAYDSRRTLRRTDYRDQEAIWTAIAAQVRDGDVVALTQDYGYRAAYWGWFHVTPWPSLADLDYRTLAGAEEDSFETLFADLTAGKRYFLVTDLQEFSQQYELRAYLLSHYRRLDHPFLATPVDVYLLFDLQQEIP